ncbi:uncharacterized protein LOC144150756 isoform X1 [Haemaphysalis longicornis]
MVVALSVVVQQLQRLLAQQLCSYLWAFNCPPSADQHLPTAVTVPLACLQHSSCHSSGNCHSSAGHLSQPNGFPTFPGFYLMHVVSCACTQRISKERGEDLRLTTVRAHGYQQGAPADWALACACW